MQAALKHGTVPPMDAGQAGGRNFSLLGRCIELCSAKPATLVFPDGEDPRAVSAAIRLRDEGLGHAVLLGRPLAVRSILRRESGCCGREPGRIRVIDPAAPEVLERNTADYMKILAARNKGKDGKSQDPGKIAAEAREYMKTGPAAGAMMVRRGEVEAGVGGNLSSTADMLRAGLRVLGVRPGGRTISSFFFMIAPVDSPDPRKVLVFADSGVIPEPTHEQLADITVDSAEQFRRMTGEEPRVALLSFSSHGSSGHPRAAFVRGVAEEVRKRRPELVLDGELQFDAAVVPEVARLKVPDSPLGGLANVLIFPSLEAGNIGYKIAQRLGGYTAIGPLLQGIDGCWHDLSRGCGADDIYQVSLIGAALRRGEN